MFVAVAGRWRIAGPIAFVGWSFRPHLPCILGTCLVKREPDRLNLFSVGWCLIIELGIHYRERRSVQVEHFNASVYGRLLTDKSFAAVKESHFVSVDSLL